MESHSLTTLAPFLLLAACFAGLLLIPLGLPGLWVIVLAIIGYGWLHDFQGMSAGFLVVVIGLAILGEIVEARVGYSFARRYGGSSRAGWGALVGGLAGAVVGVPVPLIGSVIGGFVGAFVGAALFEYTRARQSDVAARAGWGAVLGRAVAAAVKMAIGVVLSVAALWMALRS